jgi:hypothetical protein
VLVLTSLSATAGQATPQRKKETRPRPVLSKIVTQSCGDPHTGAPAELEAPLYG